MQTILVIVIIGVCLFYLVNMAVKSIKGHKGKGGCSNCGKD